MQPFHSISALRITLVSPEQIRSWSSGEVKKAETINYRTLKPERDGLFCERIFGPTKDWTCACNKYRRPRFKGRTCEKCGVTITRARVRRERMGHIELAAPVSHIWYAHGMPSRMGLLLNLSPRELDHVLSFTRYIVLDVDEEARIREVQRIKDDIVRLEAFLREEDNAVEEAQQAPQLAYQQILRQEVSSIPIGSQWVDRQVRLDESFTDSMGKSSLSHDVISDVLEVPEDIEPLDWSHTLPPSASCYEAEEEGVTDNSDAALELLSRPSVNDRIRQLQQIRHDLMELTHLSLLEVDRYRLLRDECGQVFRANIGAEAIQELLGDLDLEQMARSLRREIHDREGPLRIRAIKRLKIVASFLRSKVNPQWMILDAIPVLPPDLRPVLQLAGGRFATSDVNELYSRVLHRNNRLKHFIANGAPDLIIHREKHALQTACDSLFDNMHCRKPLVGANRQPLKSLSDSLRGKQGRFRHNLLGKRVDYSGRSVISVGLDLKLHQCGLPKKIAMELFKPFIIHKLLASTLVETPRQAKRAVERRDPVVWDILDEVMRDRLVLLNRAPSLHRLSIQAFEPVLVEGSAIRLHPQVCSAFNADFDGDQMAVHLPLSAEAQAEAHDLMLSTRNLLSAASGEPSISISQEQVLGCFYLTQERPGKKGEGRVFADAEEAMMAYAHGVIDLQARINVRMQQETIFEQPLPTPPIAHMKGQRLPTTVGRLLFNEVLPKRLQFKNYAMKKEHLKQIIWDCIKIYGAARTAILADAIKRLGFTHATKAGLSFSIKDVTIPPGKKEVLARADNKIGELSEEWRSGFITRDELYKQSIGVWQEATAEIERQVQQALDPFGSIATIASSGATKARLQQIRQLSGMRGLMASPSGTVIETPVRGNFLEGLSMAEYFISSHGARKSLMDRSLNTAEAGYLTSRFVNVAQDIIVTEEDCGTTEGLFINNKENKEMGLTDGSSRLIGRVLAESLPLVGLLAGEALNEDAIEHIIAAQITIVRVRSVLACQTRRGVCRLCYGWDLSKRALVQLGTAVGIIAAQSIGEPGTQLTMRTFHSGGIAGGQGDITQGLPRVEELFEGRVPKDRAIISESDGVVEITKKGDPGGHTIRVVANTVLFDEYPLPPGCLILLNGTGDRRQVQKGDIIAALQVGNIETGASNRERMVRARIAGELFINASGILTIREEYCTTRAYEIPPGRTLIVEAGQRIQAGEPLTTGALHLQDILRYRGREELERYLLREAQRVYRTTGAYIHDKHFEIIIRQMLRYVQIEDSGDTDLLPEDIVDSFEYKDTNAYTLAEGGDPATAHTVLLGLTQATLTAKSWLAAASFQQTSRVLTEAAIEGSIDHLIGLKENVILGKLIPAGTGILPRKTPPPQKRPARRGRRPKRAV